MGHWFESSIAHLGETVVYSVSEITLRIKDLIETTFDTVTVEGEVSNCRPSTTGHLYFTLKEKIGTSEVALAAVMFKGNLARLSFKPENGMRVQVTGALSVYAERGTYQIVATRIELAGEGEILRLLEERKRRLEADGVFSRKRRALPSFVTDITVITSPTGAAVRDIIKIAKKRNPKIHITILPAVVQGEKAAESLLAQLRLANRYKLGQLIIIGRGGGSLEDLLPFSDENLVREIAQSQLPIISAVGHEIDVALSDYAADYRAATPSEAAEIAVPLLSDLVLDIHNLYESILETMHLRLERAKMLVAGLSKENLDLNFHKIIQPILLRLDDARTAIQDSMGERLVATKHRLQLARQGIELSSPEAILRRGFSVVKKEDGSIVRSGAQVKSGERIIIIPQEQQFSAFVENSHVQADKKTKRKAKPVS